MKRYSPIILYVFLRVYTIFSIVGLSAMIAGAENGSSFIVKEYTESLVNDIFKEFFRG